MHYLLPVGVEPYTQNIPKIMMDVNQNIHTHSEYKKQSVITLLSQQMKEAPWGLVGPKKVRKKRFFSCNLVIQAKRQQEIN